MDNSDKTSNKRLAYNTIALFIRMFIIAILGLVSSRLMLQSLGAVDFGIYSVVGGVVTMMAFFNTVLASSTNRFMVVELAKGEKGDLSEIFSVSISIHIFLGLLGLILGETIGLYYVDHYLNVPVERLSDTVFVYHTSLIASCICVLQVPFQALLISYENFTRYSIVQILVVILILLSSVLLIIYPQFHLREFGLFMGLSQIIGLILYYLLSLKYIPKFKVVKEKKIYKDITNFSIWIAFGAAAYLGKGQGSNLVLNAYFNPLVNSAFSIANQVNTQISHLSENVSKAFNPQIMKAYVQADKGRLIQLISASSKYSFFLLYLVAIPFIAETDFILKVWLGKYPEMTDVFCKLMVISLLIMVSNQGGVAAVQATGNIKWYQIVLSILSLLTIPIACLGFSLGFSAYTISVAFIATSLISICARQYLLKKILDLPIGYFLKKIYLRIILVVILTYPMIYFKDIMEEGWSRFFSLLFFSMLFNLFVYYIVGLEKKERNSINNFIKRIMHK